MPQVSSNAKLKYIRSIVDACPQLTGTFPKNIIVNGCSEKTANGTLGALQRLAGELPAQENLFHGQVIRPLKW